MNKTVLSLWSFTVAILCVSAADAIDIAGTWQGGTDPQHVIKIAKTSDGRLSGEFYNVGATDPTGYPLSSINLQGSALAFEIDQGIGCATDRSDGHCLYQGKLSADGKSIVGTWQTRGPAKPMNLELATKKTAWVIDSSPHKIQMITVADGVNLEVLDWGGSGPPLIFLAGLGNTPHGFDKFAPKFTDKHHVYGITRRGFGISSWPLPTDENYNSDRLGDDVIAVIDALKLDHPIVAGHSIAGEELSSIGTRHYDKIAGLIYLEAAYGYGFYEPQVPFFAGPIDNDVVYHDLQELSGAGSKEASPLIDEILAILPNLQKQLQYQKGLDSLQSDSRVRTPRLLINKAIEMNQRKYVTIKSPFLALIAAPHECQPHCDTASAKLDVDITVAQANAVRADYPTARIVVLPYANHFIFRSNEADVTREMNDFMDGLPKS